MQISKTNNNNIISNFLLPNSKHSLLTVFKAFSCVGNFDPFIACFLLLHFLCSLRIILCFFYREVKMVGTCKLVVKKCGNLRCHVKHHVLCICKC